MLTTGQREAAVHLGGAACVIAGAGTGKTTALCERIVFLVKEMGLPPDRVLVTTFTRKATAELYDRTLTSLGELASRLWISTIDALIWDLAHQAMHDKLMRPAQLIDDAQQRVLLLHCAWETIGKKRSWGYSSSREWWTEKAAEDGLMGLLEMNLRAEMAHGKEREGIEKSIRSKLFDLRNRYSSGGFLPASSTGVPTLPQLKGAVKEYFKSLGEMGLTDYALLTRDFLKCIKSRRKFLGRCVSQFDSILVDEFQDTSRLQAEVLLLLAGKRRRIWVVGDPCQQIYEWRGAGLNNLLWYLKVTRAERYYLTENWRSTQPILDGAYNFLRKRAPYLRQKGMLKHLQSQRVRDGFFVQPTGEATFEGPRSFRSVPHPIYSATLDRALLFARELLETNPHVRPSDIAVLSRKLDKRSTEQIESRSRDAGLRVQFHSTRADRAMERTIGSPPPWRPGKALGSLYEHQKIKRTIARSLRDKDFGSLRSIRSLATAADALDSVLQPDAFTFREAWTALKLTQDRDIATTPAVLSRTDSIQVMTIHAAKGLEFPVVLLMKLGKGGPRSFPNPRNVEEARLVYVGATRAKDVLVLVHTSNKPHETLAAFGSPLKVIRRNDRSAAGAPVHAPAVKTTPPTVGATHLDLYEQCPLKFAAYHEGRFLPKWSVPQSMGSRMHKAIELWLRSGMPSSQAAILASFDRGFHEGDSPQRMLPRDRIERLRTSFQQLVTDSKRHAKTVLSIERRYTYLHGSAGQVDGVVDALIEKKDGKVVLKEWKTASDLAPVVKRGYELQARVGALGMVAQENGQIDSVEIVPIFSPENVLRIPFDAGFVDRSKEMLDNVFKDLRDRNYRPQRGTHCKLCQLKSECPAR